MSPPTTETGVERDGRHERAHRSREAVVDAMLALVRETEERPTPEAVADRAGVSRRTVFRLFEDLEALDVACVERQQAEVIRLYPPPMDFRAPLDERIDAVVTHRTSVYEHVMPLRRATERFRRDSPAIERSVRTSRKQLREHLAMLFARELDDCGGGRDELLGSLELVTSWEAWRQLRDEQKCSASKGRKLLRGLLRRNLRSSGRGRPPAC